MDDESIDAGLPTAEEDMSQSAAAPGNTFPPLAAPFPWYGGKSRAAARIWQAFGNVNNYVEPFAGSLAVLLHRPHAPKIETVNDRDAFICNVFRALQADPQTVAAYCDFPVNEAQQHAVHSWLVTQQASFTARLMGDPEFYDAKVAGWWLYGIACWIGSGWCHGAGAWQSIDGQLVHLGTAGQGVHRQRVHLGTAGQGVHRQRVHLSDAGHGGLLQWFTALQARLRYVRVCCGEWTRVLGPSVTYNCHQHNMLTGILLDPPYSADEQRATNLYRVDSETVAHAVRAWCHNHGHHPLLRIALCGYGTIHDDLLKDGWRKVHWIAHGGYSNQRKQEQNPNKYRETLWLSPACLPTAQERQLTLFTGA